MTPGRRDDRGDLGMLCKILGARHFLRERHAERLSTDVGVSKCQAASGLGREQVVRLLCTVPTYTVNNGAAGTDRGQAGAVHTACDSRRGRWADQAFETKSLPFDTARTVFRTKDGIYLGNSDVSKGLSLTVDTVWLRHIYS